MLKKIMDFIQEIRSEFKKVTWPSKTETYDSTKVVIIVVVVIAFYLGLVDIVLSGGVKKLLNESPVSVFSVNPSSGEVETSFTFDASGSYDSEDSSSDLKVRWDFEGDGIWDSPEKGYAKNKIIIHKFDSPGTFSVRLQVRDSSGAVSVAKSTLNVAGAAVESPETTEESEFSGKGRK